MSQPLPDTLQLQAPDQMACGLEQPGPVDTEDRLRPAPGHDDPGSVANMRSCEEGIKTPKMPGDAVVRSTQELPPPASETPEGLAPLSGQEAAALRSGPSALGACMANGHACPWQQA